MNNHIPFVADPVMLIDGYKLDHRRQYPNKTEVVQSNFTPRGSRVAGQNSIVWFGLQAFIKKIIEDGLKQFFASDIEQVAERYANRVNGYLGPNTIGTDHIRALHALGYLPLEFKALPEGTHVPLRVPALLIENTHPEFGWLTNYYETVLSCELWGPATSATTALRFRKLLDRYAEITGSPKEFVQWQGHDFSFRGMFGLDAAILSGMAHLLGFTGTDTIPAIDGVEHYYGVPKGYLIGGSVAATEHSVMCAGGEDNEEATIDRLLTLYVAGILSIVSDTWDLWNLIVNILPKFKERILARDGKIVIRPDSGDPVKIVCGTAMPVATVDALSVSNAYSLGYDSVRAGDKFYRIVITKLREYDKIEWQETAPTPQMKGVIELLWDIFGGTETATGHKLLDAHIGCIYGDGISFERAEAILEGLHRKGFASANMVFGMGSYTYQYVTRDTYNFAMKATWVQISGKPIDIFKAPKTDDGMKNSARGRLAVLKDDAGNLVLVNQATPEQEAQSLLRSVWKDGKFVITETFDVIRERALAG